MTGGACCAAFFSACQPAILNAISDESTSWKAPSSRVTFKLTSGSERGWDTGTGVCEPASTEGMYSRGIWRLVTLFPKS